MSQEDIKRAKEILENASITDSPFGEMCGEILEYIESLEERIAIMSEGGWHKITENADSYPKESNETDVWICCEDENGYREVFKAVYYVRHFYDCAGWLYTKNNGWKITHWMYRRFPEPPKEGEPG